MAFKYPKHPNTDRPNPFDDGRGQNPFADPQETAPRDTGDRDELSPNLYKSPVHNAINVSQSGSMETTFPHRARPVFWLGMIGLTCASLGGLGVLGLLFAPMAIKTLGFQLCGAMLPFGLCCSWAAWMMGRHDLSAMRAGAMAAEGRRRTRIGCWAGILGTFLTIAPLMYLAVVLVSYIFAEL